MHFSGQNETTAAPTGAYEDLTSDANSPAPTTLWPELNTDLSPSWNDTADNNNSSTAENTTTTPLATGYYTTEGPPLSFNSTDNITSSSVSSSSSSSSPVNSTSESLPPPATGSGQRFDLASFFGGIILSVGLLALVFFVYKVWQSKRSGYSNI